MPESGTLIASLIWGTLGSGFTIYGWKQRSYFALATGWVLVGISYFINTPLYMSLAAIVALLTAYWVKKRAD